MKTKLIAWLMAAVFAGLATGCVETVDGRKQPGVPFVNDKVERLYEKSVAELFDASKKVLAADGAWGVLVAENTLNHSLEARIDQSSVWVRVEEVDATKPKSRLIVQARTTGGAADRDLAYEVDKRIALRLATDH
jgi:hypothetical protein